jgi:hypothetical protein
MMHPTSPPAFAALSTATAEGCIAVQWEVSNTASVMAGGRYGAIAARTIAVHHGRNSAVSACLNRAGGRRGEDAAAALVDIGALGGYAPDQILRSHYWGHCGAILAGILHVMQFCGV